MERKKNQVTVVARVMTLQSRVTTTICEYVRLYGRRGIKVADGVKVANMMNLKKGDYPGVSN